MNAAQFTGCSRTLPTRVRCLQVHNEADDAAGSPPDYICFMDNATLANSGNWTFGANRYDIILLSLLDTGTFTNLQAKNHHPYMIYKFWKTQFYRFPRLQSYNMIVWIDMTRRFFHSRILLDLWNIFQQYPTKAIIALSHWPMHNCDPKLKMEALMRNKRWNGTLFLRQP
jgi:hypothetical protein